MRTPSAAELIRVWELGEGRRPCFRGLLLLAPLNPGASLRDLALISLGTRNALLLRLRALMFGSALEAIVTCPQCAVPVEFSITVDELLDRHARDCTSVYDTGFGYDVPEGRVEYRLLCTADLQAASDIDGAGILPFLGARATISSSPGLEVNDPLLEANGDAALTSDPLAEIRLGIACASCVYEWDVDFDVVSFLWKEIDAEVERLFDDVHRLSVAYGWSEAVVLTMSAQRRRRYLERST